MIQSAAALPALDESELAARVASLSLEQKVRLLTGADFWSLHPEPAVGLRRLVVSDGPAGVRGERWDERDPSANVPSPTALAATWDEELAEELGGLLASEARRKGVDVVLAPTVNLHRTPYAGRHFECFSEDPLLTARIGVSYVFGLQDGGVGATVKHFIANDSETERMTLDARLDERTLRELYLAPFEAIVREAGVWSVMASYNAVNGESMTESSLLRDILQRELGFDGLVMSDWFATRSTTASARAALDLVMPGPDGPWDDALVEAVRAGKVDPATIDDKVLRVLRLAARVGALEGTVPARPPAFDDGDIAATLRRIAAAGFVLARNERALLPLDRGRLERIAVIGPNAAAARTLGGGSATVLPPYVVSPLEGLRSALGPGVQIDHSLGVQPSRRVPVAPASLVHVPGASEPGVEVRFLDAGGGLLASERRRGCAFKWLGSLDVAETVTGTVARIEVHTVLRATDSGTYAIGASGLGRYRLTLDGREAFDERLELPPGADIVEGLMVPPQAVHIRELGAGEEIGVVLTHDVDAPSQRRRPSRREFSAECRATVRRGRPRNRARGRDCRRSRCRCAGRRHDRGGRERGVRPGDAVAPGSPGRVGPSRRGRQPQHDRGRERGRPGADAVGRRGRRGIARVVPGTGVRQRARRCAARRHRARRPPSDHLAGNRVRPSVGPPGRRRPAL